MAMSNITVAGLTPDLKILGDYQRFHFMDSDHTVKVQAFSEFVPVSLTDSVINFELRNNLLSGFRLSQISTDSDVNPFGSFKFQSFASDGPGTDIFGFDGSTFSLSTPLSMTNHKITNLATPTVGTDAATKAYVDSSVSGGTQTLTGAVTGSGPVGGSISTTIATTLNNIPLATGNINANSQRITLLADPVGSSDAANKDYVDTEIANTSLTLTGEVTASGTLGSPIATTITSTLDAIPLASGTINLNNNALINVTTIDLSTKITFGGTPATDAISFPNTSQIRRLVLWNDLSTYNNYQFSGLGTASDSSILYNVSTGGSHQFYEGTSSSTSALMVKFTPTIPMMFDNVTNECKICLYQVGANSFQLYGFGVTASTLKYTVDAPSSKHAFYVAASSSSSTELFRIAGTGYAAVSPTGSGTMYCRVPSVHVRMANNATTTSGTANTWVKIAGTTTATSGAVQFTTATSNRIVFTGTDLASACVGMVSGNATIAVTNLAATRVGIAIYKNGTTQIDAPVYSTTNTAGSTNQPVSVSISPTMVSLSPNDYLEVWVFSSANTTITVTNMNLGFSAC